MRKPFILFLLLLLYPFATYAQEVFINADFVSSHMWRGMKCGNATVQPALGLPSLHGALPSSDTKTMK